MLRLADLIEKHNDQIATLETWDTGKPYAQAAKIEVPMVVRLLRYYAGMLDNHMKSVIVFRHFFHVGWLLKMFYAPDVLLLILQAGQIKFMV